MIKYIYRVKFKRKNKYFASNDEAYTLPFT